MKQIKNSIAFVIYNKSKTKFLAVKRPADDENLPNIWGLPAGSLKENEAFEEAVLRAGKEKLGVELKIIKEIGSGTLEREQYTLYLKDFEAEIVSGKPKVPQPVKEVTQYTALKWAVPKELVKAAQKGSLCSRIFLSKIGVKW